MIQAPPEYSLGPAMLALSKPMRCFVVALLETGGIDATRAAGAAGYGGTQNSQWQAAHRLSHNPKVMLAIKEEADKRLRAGAILAASALVEICGDVRHKDRFKAAQELLNRAGLIVQTEHKVIVEDNRTTDEIEQAIILLARRNGIDPTKLLGPANKAAQKAEAIDGEFEEVDDLSDLMEEANEDSI